MSPLPKANRSLYNAAFFLMASYCTNFHKNMSKFKVLMVGKEELGGEKGERGTGISPDNECRGSKYCILNLVSDLDPKCWPNLNPDLGLFYQFVKNV